MEFLSNPVYLGLIIAAFCLLTSVFIPVVIYLKQRSKKEISYIVLDNVPLLNIKEEVKESFEVRYYSYPVKDATFLFMRIWNSGNVPIEEADVIDPIKLDFGKNAIVFFSSVASDHANILCPSQDGNLKGEGYLTFKPRLLNKGYGFSVAVMVTGFSGFVKAEGLIKDVHSIRYVPYTSKPDFPWKRMHLFSVLACEISILVGVLALLSSFGIGFFTKAPDFPSSTFHFIAMLTLLSALLSGYILLEIYSRMNVATRTSQPDDKLIKQLFSITQAKMESEIQATKSQQAKTTSTLRRK